MNDKEIEEDNKLGEAIAYWIATKGSLDLDTSEKEILKYYGENN